MILNRIFNVSTEINYIKTVKTSIFKIPSVRH